MRARRGTCRRPVENGELESDAERRARTDLLESVDDLSTLEEGLGVGVQRVLDYVKVERGESRVGEGCESLIDCGRINCQLSSQATRERAMIPLLNAKKL